MEWAQDGVRVNAVAPGSNIYSPTAASNYGDMNVFEAARGGVPMKRLGTTEEVSGGCISYFLTLGASVSFCLQLQVHSAFRLFGKALMTSFRQCLFFSL